MRYLAFIGRRLVQLLPVLFGITFIVFFMIHLVPGDPARTLLGVHATDQAVAELHEKFGLDKPLWQQYLDFLGRLVHGDLGTSYFYNDTVTSLVMSRLPATLWLIGMAGLLAVLISVPLAVIAASRRNGVLDNVIRVVPLVALGMPAFWLGIMLILLLALRLQLFPVSGFGDDIPGHLHSIFLPALTVALAMTPILIRSLRTSMVGVLESDYITTAQAKGLSTGRVTVNHALRNALISSVTVLGGAGNDRLDASGLTRGVTLVGGVGDDTIIGSAGDDTIDAGEGNDSITAGAGPRTTKAGSLRPASTIARVACSATCRTTSRSTASA